MLHFEGDRRFEQPIDVVWSKLRDAQFLAESIPDGSIDGAPTRDRVVCTVQPGLSFLRGALEVTLEVAAAEEPSSIRLRISSKGIGSNSVVGAVLALSTQDGATSVHWAADVESLGGLLKLAPAGLIRGAAQKVIEDLWTGVASRMSTS